MLPRVSRNNSVFYVPVMMPQNVLGMNQHARVNVSVLVYYECDCAALETNV